MKRPWKFLLTATGHELNLRYWIVEQIGLWVFILGEWLERWWWYLDLDAPRWKLRAARCIARVGAKLHDINFRWRRKLRGPAYSGRERPGADTWRLDLDSM